MIKYSLVYRYSGVHSMECYKCGARLIHGSYKSSTDLRRTIRGWRLE